MNIKSAGKTALQVASHQGGLDMVKLLLKARADVEMKDNDGDTALHYSAFGYVCSYLSLEIVSARNYRLNRNKNSAIFFSCVCL